MTFRLNLRIIFVTLIILIITIILITGILLTKNRNTSNFKNILKKIDISENKLEIKELYSSALKVVKSPIQYKSLLKRLFLKADFDNLLRISSIAYKTYPDDSQILSIYLFALLKIDNYKDALKVISQLKNKLVEENFIIETNILSGNISSGDNIYYNVLQANDSALFKELFQKTKNKNFLIDSGLLYLENGDYKSAESVFSNLTLEKNELNKLLFYVNYYTGQFQKASDLLSMYDFGFKVEDLKLIQIDLLIKQKSYLKADKEISKFIKLYPFYSPVPYINTIIINLRNMTANVKFKFEDVLSQFPDNRTLLLAIVDYSIKINKEDDALTFINKYGNRNSSDEEINIILRQIKGISNPEYLVNSLYELVNKYPDNEEASRFLAMNLYENRNMDNLEKYLNRLNSDNSKGWIMFYKSLLDSFKGNFKTALDKSEISYKLDRHWETLYNLSILSEHTKDYNNAIEYLQKAENSFMSNKNNLEIKSIIRTKLAVLYFDMKDYNKSYREIKNALDLDNTNMQANLLLKKLESATY